MGEDFPLFLRRPGGERVGLLLRMSRVLLSGASKGDIWLQLRATNAVDIGLLVLGRSLIAAHVDSPVSVAAVVHDR